ncbi:rhodanese-like domain-containing protein [Hydrogenovibrio sp. 3SP14C1]|uniref:rhodanese-like domain-containing protein n=1 Tax=Hydrogenovibrio sp. 3SP14C1 TaxID=3038774 RepID=UPI002415B718|nr:rhodanese-like domain-containing protein [Hydrogenovibrio sp. 3SP14C1]MDG4812226.1 rhodanese-like domain-containing protein [Hydrogenovibrio sp. 3SP14C1]
MLNKFFILSSVLFLSFQVQAAHDLDVKITEKLAEVTVKHNGQPVTIMRNQDQQNQIDEDFALTSRACPPFCLQPMNLLPGVKTIGELEMLDFLKRKAAGDDSILIIDSRTPDWVAKGTIPSATNIPWTKLFPQSSSFEPLEVEGILTFQFGASVVDNIWDFSHAKTLVMFCNGPWCGQSPTNIKALVSMGYPAHKIYWYRGGMQAWHAAGLTTVSP